MARYQKKIATAIRRGTATETVLQGLFDELRAAMGPELAAIMTQRSLELTAETGITFDAAIISEEALGRARDYNYRLVTGLTDTTRKLVQESVSTFVETPGMTRGDLERLLAPAFGKNRAEMIAVTEVTRAYSQATNQHQDLIREETGLEMRRRWDTLRDELVCPICGPLNGMPEEDWPANLKDGPPAHPRCRCSSSLTLDDEATVRAEAIAKQTAREKLLREKVEGEKVPQQLQYRAGAAQQIEAQRLAEKDIEKWARARNESPEQMKAAIQQRLERDLNNPIAIRRGDQGALNVLEEGRFKTQFETGTSGGAFAPELRIEAEDLGLGIATDARPGERPIYGYVSTDATVADYYGVFEFQLEDEIKDRSTITLGDSLVRFADERLAGTPLRNPGMEGWGKAGLRYHDMGVGGIGYIETQIQGDVAVEDIARLIIHDVMPTEGAFNPYERHIRLAKKRGIEVIFANP